MKWQGPESVKSISGRVIWFFVASLAAAFSRTWTTRDGRTFDAELCAADGLRATFSQPKKPAVVVPLARLVPADGVIVRDWRRDWRRPLIVPSRLAPWPAQAVAPAGDVITGEHAGVFTCESANFRITSDLKLPPVVANDIAKVLEATRAALIAMPLGLHAGGERERYAVAMFRDSNGYERAGGGGGSGGFYDGHTRRMLVLLPNLGIEEKPAGSLRLDYARNMFILKHEVTHQLMARWHRRIPMWAYEGIAEFVASLPYARGCYTLQSPGSGMHDYLLKWRKSPTARGIRLIPPARLMAMREDDWTYALTQQDAYDLYNSAALLTYYFIQQDDGKPLAGFLDAIRRGENQTVAENTYLLRGNTRQSLAKDIIALGKKLGVDLTP